MTGIDVPLLAAIRVTKDRPVDDLLEEAARLVRAEGLAVAGFVQRESTGDGECCGEIVLEDLASGQCHVISQPLGAGARGCRLDPQALAAVAGPLPASLDAGPALLILNRFGKGESEGQGFRAAIEDACMRGIPVLTAVREAYVEAWEAFAGDLGLLLPPDREAVTGWAGRAIRDAGQRRDAA